MKRQSKEEENGKLNGNVSPRTKCLTSISHSFFISNCTEIFFTPLLLIQITSYFPPEKNNVLSLLLFLLPPPIA